jgi:hypothetical protein
MEDALQKSERKREALLNENEQLRISLRENKQILNTLGVGDTSRCDTSSSTASYRRRRSS